MLATPTFHHLHLNSTDPQRAVDFYLAQFATSKKATWQGLPAVAAPNDVLLVMSNGSFGGFIDKLLQKLDAGGAR